MADRDLAERDPRNTPPWAREALAKATAARAVQDINVGGFRK